MTFPASKLRSFSSVNIENMIRNVNSLLNKSELSKPQIIEYTKEATCLTYPPRRKIRGGLNACIKRKALPHILNVYRLIGIVNYNSNLPILYRTLERSVQLRPNDKKTTFADRFRLIAFFS